MISDPAWVSYKRAVRIASADVVRVATSKTDGFHPNGQNIITLISSMEKECLVQ